MLNRRTTLLGITAGMTAPAILRAQPKSIVMNVPGGIYERNFREHVSDPFEKKTGVKIELRFKGAAEVFTSMLAQRQDPEYDIAFLSYPTAMRAIRSDGVFIDLAPEQIPNVRDIDSLFFDGYDRRAVGFNYAPYGLGFAIDHVKPSPTSWKDLWRPELKGRITLSDISGGFTLETIVLAAMIHGGSIENLDPGFAALRALKPNIFRLYKSAPEAAQLFERGEVWIGGLASSRIYTLQDAGKQVDWTAPSEGTPVGVLSFHVARFSKVRDLALQFVDFALGREPQEGFANGIEFGACNAKAELRGKAKTRVPPHAQLMRIDWRRLAPQMNALNERWQREIAS
jgi:putative spermidine/putrescine transport system substrate-binding protein